MTRDDQIYWDEVVKSVLDGDIERFREIVSHFQYRLRFAVAYYVRSDAERIDEIVHCAFIRAFQSLDGFETGRPLGPWLKQIARNVARNEARKLCREARSKKEFIDAAITEAREPCTAPFDQLPALRHCLDALSGKVHRLVQMYYFEKKSFDDMGEILGRSAGALRVAMLKTRRRLRECVEKQVEA